MDQAAKQKEAIGRRQFNIDVTEQFIDLFSCKYKSKLSPTGSLWIFRAHFCYYSNIFGSETKLLLALADISQITPSGNSSIELFTVGGQDQGRHKFFGFSSKEGRDAVVKHVLTQQSENEPTVVGDTRPHSNSQESVGSDISSAAVDAVVNHPDIHSFIENVLQSDFDDGQSQTDDERMPSANPSINRRSQSQSKTMSPKIVRKNATLMHALHDNGTNALNAAPILSPLRVCPANHAPPKPNRNVGRSRDGTITAQTPQSHFIRHVHDRNFTLAAIHSQQSLKLTTPFIPFIHDSDADESDANTSANAIKHSVLRTMDTMDILNETATATTRKSKKKRHRRNNRDRSYSDSEMQRYARKGKTLFSAIDDVGDDDGAGNPETSVGRDPNESGTKHERGGSRWWNMFRQTKKSTNTSASLGNLQSMLHAYSMNDADSESMLQDRHDQQLVDGDAYSKPASSLLMEEKRDADVEDECAVEKAGAAATALEVAAAEATREYVDESFSGADIDLGSLQNLQWSPLYSDEFWTTPLQFFHKAYSEEVVQQTHADRGSTQLKIGAWSVDPELPASGQPAAYIRNLEYITQIKDPPPFMPSKTEVDETQRFRFYGSRCLVVDVSISTPNIKYGDHFLIVNRFVFSSSDEDKHKTRFECSIAFKWIKKTWFERLITSKATSEAAEGMVFWAAKLHELFPPPSIRKQPSSQAIGHHDNMLLTSSPRSPQRRVIDPKIIDYFHTPKPRKEIVMQEWIRPMIQIASDVLRMLCQTSTWKELYDSIRAQADVEDALQRNLQWTAQHTVMVTLVLFVLCLGGSLCCVLVWIWYTSALNRALYQQNQILLQQSEIFLSLLQVLNETKGN